MKSDAQKGSLVMGVANSEEFRRIRVGILLGVSLAMPIGLIGEPVHNSAYEEKMTAGSSYSVSFAGPRAFRFWWKVSSERNHDYLKCWVDDTVWDKISGEVDWCSRIVTVGAGTHKIKWAYEKDSSGTAGSDCGWVDISESDIPMPEALNPECTFSTGGSGDSKWFVQTSTTYDGLAVQSGPISNNQSTWLTSQIMGPAEVSFRWRVSSEANYDFLKVLVDGAVQDKISGSTGWAVKKLQIGSGYHTLKWEYAKDSSNSSGSDCGWIDDLKIGVPLPDALDTTLPVSTTRYSGWFGQSSTSRDGQDAARSCPNCLDSQMTLDVEGPCEMSFWWKVSSKKDQDFLKFLVDGTELKSISGEMLGWQQVSESISDGTHTVVWEYVKGGSEIEGEDCGWVDQLSIEIPIRGAIDTALDVWTGGTKEWHSETGVTHDGKDAARSGTIPDDGSSQMAVDVEGPAEVSFWWKTSSEEGFDKLAFYDNGASCGTISGFVDWQLKEVHLGPGSHHLIWEYSKDSSDYSGEDCGWVDEFTVSPPAWLTVDNPDGTATIVGTSVRHSGTMTMPSAIDGKKVTGIAAKAFQSNCGNVTTVVFPSTIERVGSEAFWGCRSLKEVRIDDLGAWARIEFEDYLANPLCSYAGAKLLLNGTEVKGEVTIPNAVTRIGSYAFYGCSGMTSLILPEGVTTIGAYAFSECRNLSHVDVPTSLMSVDMGAFDKTGAITVNVKDLASWCQIAFATPGSNPLGPYDRYAVNDNAGTLALNGETVGHLVIPVGVERIGDYAFNNCRSLTSVTISQGVKDIGKYAFYGCVNLSSPVVIPAGVSNIANGLFEECRKLPEVCIPEGVTNIGQRAFQECLTLSNVSLPVGIRKIGNSAFAYCSELTTVDFPEGLVEIGASAFKSCSKLKSVELPQGVLTIGAGAFGECGGMTALVLPAGLKDIGSGAFSRCAIIELEMPESVTNIGSSAFYSCVHLEKVFVPGCVASIGDDAFQYCSGLMSVTLAEGVQGFGESAFAYCEKLKTLVLPRTVKTIGGHAFEGCNSLRDITFPLKDAHVGTRAFGCSSSSATVLRVDDLRDWLTIDFADGSANPLQISGHFVVGGKELGRNLTIPDGVTTIKQYAFYYYPSGISSLKLPSSLTWVGKYAFYGYGVGAVDVTDVNAWCNIEFENVETNPLYYNSGLRVNGQSIAGDLVLSEGIARICPCAFRGLSALTSVVIPEGVVEIGEKAFYDCDSLREVTIPSSLKRVGKDAFGSDYDIESVHISDLKAWCEIEFANQYAQPLYGAFGGMASLYVNDELLTALEVPDGVERIGGATFANYYRLTSVEIPSGVQSIGSYAFYETSIKTVTVPSSVTNVEAWAFANSSLRSVVLEEGVETIGQYAFRGCTGLTTIEIPESVRDIGYYAFDSCKNIETIYVSPGRTQSVKDLMRRAGFYSDTPKYVEIRKVTLTFDLGAHGCRSGGGELVQKVMTGTEVVPPEVNPDAGWRFVGWNKAVVAGEMDETFVAQYEVIGYEISYADSQERDNPNPRSYTVEDEIAFMPLADTATARFLGWSPAKIEKGTTGCISVTARWEMKTVADLLRGAYGVCAGGTLPWNAQWTGAQWVLRSGAIGDGQVSEIRANIAGTGVLTFKWKASSEIYKSTPIDKGVFVADGIVRETIGGVTDWVDCTVELPRGQHEVVWRYLKDESGAEGEDCIWLKDIVWTAEAVFDSVATLSETFSDDSDVVKNIVTEQQLAEFNVFLQSVNVARPDELTDSQKTWAYQSFKLSAIVTAPQLFEEEPVLKIDDVELSGGNLSLTISLTAGAEAIQLANDKLAEKVRVGTSLNSIIDKPDIVTSMSKDGTSVTFTITPPQGNQGFVRVIVE